MENGEISCLGRNAFQRLQYLQLGFPLMASIGKWAQAMIICLAAATGSFLWAQTSGDAGQTKSWNSVNQSQMSGSTNPTRTSTSYSESGNRKTETQALERMGMDGHYEPYLTVEKETIKVNSTTTKTVDRSYVRDSNGERQLIQVTEEQSQTLGPGTTRTVRTTSNPDPNGNLQLVKREIEEQKQISPTVHETNTSVLTTDANGGLSESQRIERRETQSDSHTVQFQQSTQVRDVNGGWQTSEVRKGIVQENGTSHSREEEIAQPDADGKLAVVQRTTSKESEGVTGDKKITTETSSVDLPGTGRDGTLHPVERVTTVHLTGLDGTQSTQTQIENPNPGSPTDGMYVIGRTIDIVKPGPAGITRETQTIQSIDGNRALGTVWVETGTSDQPAPFEINVTGSAKAQATQPSTKPSSPPTSQSTPPPK